MQPDDWKPVLRTEAEFARAVERFLRQQLPYLPDLTSLEDWKLPTSGPEADAIAQAAEMIARSMVAKVNVTNARHWREAAAQSMRSRQMYQALRTEMGGPVGMRVSEIVRTNTKLLQRLPDRIARQAAAWVGGQQRAGKRAGEIAAELQARLPKLTRSTARTLARTEVARADTALSQARSERFQIQWYEWLTSKDKRVRQSHKLFNHVLVAWADPPNPEQMAGEPTAIGHYHPGGTYNCRCIAAPLIDLAEVTWPHKVYSHGRIEYVQRHVFERWIRLPQAA